MNFQSVTVDPGATPALTPEQQAAAAGGNTPAAGAEGTGERPTWLPEKFKTPEEMAKAYSELEGKLGKPTEKSAEKPAEEGEKKPSDDLKVTDADPEVVDALSKAGLNADELAKEFSEKGELSAESYEALTKAGYPKAMVDTYLNGLRGDAAVQEVLTGQMVADVKSAAGGEAEYTKLTAWAATSLAPDELEAYNAIMDGGDLKQIKFAVTGLSDRYKMAEGREPQRQVGGAAASTSDTFDSVAQVTAAMRDPRYKSDSAYREQIQQKVMRSNVF